MKKVVLIAPTGMLGSMVFNVLKDHTDLILLYRDLDSLQLLQKVYGKVRNHRKIKFDITELYQDFLNGFSSKKISPTWKKIVKQIGDIDTVINCAGIIKPYSLNNPAFTLFINGAFPHILSNTFKEKLIQITTDCVFSGLEGAPYDENSIFSPNDLYGISKSLGEPKEYSLVLRTSIIGPELDGHVSLLDWVKRQKGEVNGFTNHYWNGITTRQFGEICKEIIMNRKKYPKRGLFHIFSTDVTKYEMLQTFQRVYSLPISIKPVKAEVGVDRRLKSKYIFSKTFKTPSFEDMIKLL